VRRRPRADDTAGLARNLQSLDAEVWLTAVERAFIVDRVQAEDLEALQPLTPLARFAFMAITADGRGRCTGGSAVEFIERHVVAGRRRRAGWRFAEVTRQPRARVALGLGLGWCQCRDAGGASVREQAVSEVNS
jgi:hypothetical protein